jgi:hypothetical protein
MMAAVSRRCENLEPQLFKAINAIERDLGMSEPKPPEDRDYPIPDAEHYAGSPVGG